MKRSLPAHVYARTRKSGTYVYYEAPGAKPVRLMALPGTADFQMELAEAMKSQRPMLSGRSFKVLIGSYRASRKWKRLAPRTQKDYAKVMDWIERKLGDVPADRIQRKDIITIRDNLADSVRFANYVVQVIRILLEHAIDLGWKSRDQNEAKGVALLKSERPKREAWPLEKIEAFRAAAPLGSRARTAFELMLGTGQRIGDVLKMRWGDIRDGTILVEQGKTGVRLTLPLTAALRDALAAVDRVEPKVALVVDGTAAGPTILQRLDGAPIGYRVVADEIMAVRREIGAEDFDNHALRHATAVELAELGLTDEQIMAVTGHKESATLRIYTHEARQRSRARQAMAARERGAIEERTSEQKSEQPFRPSEGNLEPTGNKEKNMEAGTGIEPVFTDLQSAA